MKENILLVFGGPSVEHEISIITALQVYKNYHGNYHLIPVYLGKDHCFYYHPSYQELSIFKNWKDKAHKKDKIQFIANQYYFKKSGKKIHFKAIYLVVHGKNCEDGSLYSFFKTLNLCCIAMRPYQAIIGQDKYYMKKLTTVPQVPYCLVKEEELNHSLNQVLQKIEQIQFPCILKPVKLGSSVGIKKIHTLPEFIEHVHDVFAFDDEIVVEKFIEDLEEYNIAIIRYANHTYYSEIEKIINHDILTYKDKYINDKKSMSGMDKELPAKIKESLRQEIIDTALKVYTELNMEYCCRIDFIYDKKEKKLYFNEINNIPGSLSFYLFEPCNISITKLIDMIIHEGLYKWDIQLNQIESLKENVFEKFNLSHIKLCK